MNLSKITRTTFRTGTTAAALTLLLAFRAGAVDVADTPLKVFTFAGNATENAMQAKDYPRVINQYRTFGSWFGFHDLVNLCAARIFEGDYRAARRTCTKAANFRSSASVRTNRRDVWAAHANYAVASALLGDYDAARRAMAKARHRGDEQALLDHNRVAIEQLATPGTEISFSE